MNEQMANAAPAASLGDSTAWLPLPFVLIALGIVAALLVLWWGMRLGRRRRHTRDELIDRGEAQIGGQPLHRGEAPPVAPSPPPLADAPVPETAPVPEPAPDRFDQAPREELPDHAGLADEPIAATAPLEASPATLGADLAAPEPEAPEEDLSPAPTPASAADGADDLTRMKGVGPKLAARLNEAGVTRFAQIAALTPEDAAALDAQLGSFQGRIHRDRWIEQARFLAAGDKAGYEAVFGKL